MFAKVVINIPLEKVFSYRIPIPLEEQSSIGKRVLVPLGKRKVTGFIVELLNLENFEGLPIKDIIEFLDTEPLFNEEDLKFYRWVSQYYMSPLGKVMAEFLPGGIDIKSNRWITLKQENIENKNQNLSATKQAIVERLKLFPKGISFTRLRNALGAKDISKDLRELLDAQLIEVDNKLQRTGIARKREKIIKLSDKIIDRSRWTTKQISVIDFIQRHGSTSMNTLRDQFKHVSHIIKNWNNTTLSRFMKGKFTVCRIVPPILVDIPGASPSTNFKEQLFMRFFIISKQKHSTPTSFTALQEAEKQKSIFTLSKRRSKQTEG